MGRTKRHFPPETKLEVVQRYVSGESSGALGREYSIRPTLVHQWVIAYRRLGLVGLRMAGRPSKAAALAAGIGEPAPQGDALALAQRRIALLEQKVGQQQLEIDFFKLALQHIETSCPPVPRSGTTAPAPSSRRKRSGKAD